MSLTDERKLFFTKQEFNRKIENISSWATMLNLINNITPAQVKGFLRSNLQDVVDERGDRIIENETLETDLVALQEEIDPS